jgi:hypothetical protein
MSVDLAAGTSGILTMRSGIRWFCPIIEPNSDGSYSVRIEHGWYNEYHRDGTQIAAGTIVRADGREERVVNHEHDIIAFMPTAICPSGMLNTPRKAPPD